MKDIHYEAEEPRRAAVSSGNEWQTVGYNVSQMAQ